MKLKGYIYKSELNEYLKIKTDEDLENYYKKYSGPLTLEVWRDGDDLRSCWKGSHIIEVEIEISPSKKKKRKKVV